MRSFQNRICKCLDFFPEAGGWLLVVDPGGAWRPGPRAPVKTSQKMATTRGRKFHESLGHPRTNFLLLAFV